MTRAVRGQLREVTVKLGCVELVPVVRSANDYGRELSKTYDLEASPGGGSYVHEQCRYTEGRGHLGSG